MGNAVVYVGNFFFPNGNASGKRVHGNLKAIQDAGYVPYAIGFHTDNEKIKKQEVDGIISYSIQYCTGSKRLDNRKPYGFFLDSIRKISAEDDVKVVIMYGSLGTVGFNKRIIRFCNRKKIVVLYDLVDMFNKPSKNNLLRYIVKKWELAQLQNCVIRRCDGGIGISSYIQKNVFGGMCSIVVPPLAIMKSKPVLKKDNFPIVIAYATYMSDKNRPVAEWKDRVDAIVDLGISLVESNIKNFCFKFIGFTEENLIDMFVNEEKEKYRERLRSLHENIIFLGPCTNEVAQNEIMNSDFTILLRDSKVSTNAGFPTKVSESLALGVPVLSNLTSDLGSYIIDGKNGFLLKDPSETKQNLEILKRVLLLDFSQINEMKMTAIEDCAFDYRKYSDCFGEFLRQIEGRKKDDLE